jgi:hypothetical protein
MAKNFNYIAFGNRDNLEDPDGQISMSRGRMFEYTPTDISQGLYDLEMKSLRYIESLPTLLCSEMFQSTDGSPTMVIKFGKVRKIIVNKREVSATFYCLLDFGQITFGSTEDIQETFDGDRWQFHRTHWAVREGDIYDVLTRLTKFAPDFLESVEAFKNFSTMTKPPVRKKDTLGTAKDVQSYLNLLFKFSATDSTETFYRGHESSTFELTPSLMRKWPDGSANRP